MANSSVGYTESDRYQCLEDLEQLYPFKSVSNLFLAYCGKEKCMPGKTFGPYVRDNYVIHVITAGSGVYRVGGLEYTLSEGHAFVIYPGEETIYTASEEDPWEYAWIGFNGFRADAAVEAAGFTREVPVVTLSDTARFVCNIDKMLAAKDLTMGSRMRRQAAFFESLADLIDMNEHETKRLNRSESRYVNMAIELISTLYSNKIRISDIANHLGVNRSYLSTLFKREMNVSPQEFLINYRLGKAAVMLTETKSPIGDIATAVGYSDALAFSKAFRQKYGVSPSQYRESETVLMYIDRQDGYDGSCKL